MSEPVVGVIMGSRSDERVMSGCAEVLDRFDVPFEMTVVSAHRTPERMVTYARSAEERGLRVIVAGAGGAAHLPGMVASLTTLPVIGVPVRSTALDGTDSLLSIVQMPKGVPVATVAIDGAQNAGLLAVQILSLGEPRLRAALQQFRQEARSQVMEMARRVEARGECARSPEAAPARR
jgi:5-(carboxyamino)imidazole ribonucleotide mutase